MNAEPVKIRPYQEGDEERILELFHAVFGPSYSIENWRWQFKRNPFSRPIIWVAEAQDGTLVAHYCLIPVPYCHEGLSLKAAFSILSMVHPEFQRRGLLKRLAEACDGQLQEDNVALGLTFLNDNSLPVYTSHFGWRKSLEKLPVYFRILDAGAVLGRYLPSPLSLVFGKAAELIYAAATIPLRLSPGNSRFQIGEIHAFDSRFDELWREFSRHLESGVERSRRYLDWRFSANPKQYRIFAAEDAGCLGGFAVVREHLKFNIKMGYIAELIFLKKQVGIELLRHACQVLKQSGCGMVTGLFTDHARYGLGLRMNRFMSLPGFLLPHGIHFCEKSLSADITRLPGSRIYLSWSDHDVV